jgi:hypothetical protein
VLKVKILLIILSCGGSGAPFVCTAGIKQVAVSRDTTELALQQFTPATTTHQAMMGAVKDCSPEKKEQLGLGLGLGREPGMAWHSKMQLQLFVSSQL